MFSSTLTHSQCDAGNITFLQFFAVFDVLLLECRRQQVFCFVHL